MSLPTTSKELQSELQALHFYQGEIDGQLGPRSRAALDDYLSSISQIGLSKFRHISADGLSLVKEFEGLFLKAYQDEVGVWTIGWGHTGLQHKDGTVFKGRVIAKSKAEELLAYDMRQFEARVESLVTCPLNQDQFDALVSFDFNTGGLTLGTGNPSTILRRLNAARYDDAADEFPKWNKAGGRVLAGLTRRRKSERNLFLSKRPFIVS